MFSLLIKVVSGIFPFSKEHLWIRANNRSIWQKCEIPTHFQVTQRIHMHHFQWDCLTNSYREKTSTVGRMHEVHSIRHNGSMQRACLLQLLPEEVEGCRDLSSFQDHSTFLYLVNRLYRTLRVDFRSKLTTSVEEKETSLIFILFSLICPDRNRSPHISEMMEL